jgi:hypothetical protein
MMAGCRQVAEKTSGPTMNTDEHGSKNARVLFSIRVHRRSSAAIVPEEFFRP